jgi:hypothetical protein
LLRRPRLYQSCSAIVVVVVEEEEVVVVVKHEVETSAFRRKQYTSYQ